jgi:hypothetical protein
MKSYFLENLADDHAAAAALSEALPHWTNPWTLRAGDNSVIAYFNVERTTDRGLSIQADISGNQFNEDEVVIQLLRSLQAKLGGTITDDDDNEI